jgi:hypothetical protein
MRPWVLDRFTGHCHACRRDDREVETRYDHGARTLCDDCASRATNHAEGSLQSAVSGPGPGPGTRERDLPLVYELLGLWRAGKIKPVPVRLGRLPEHATEPMRLIADDIALRLGLLLAEGVTRALPYARSEAVRAGYIQTKGGASYALRRLVDEDVIRCVGEMPKLGKGNGTGLFVPPGWRPVDPLAVELAGEHGLADLVWIPDQPELVGLAVEPDAEQADQPFIGGSRGSLHEEDPPSLSGREKGGQR